MVGRTRPVPLSGAADSVAGCSTTAVLTTERYDRPPTSPQRHAGDGGPGGEHPPDAVALATAMALAGVRRGSLVLDLSDGGWFTPAATAAAGLSGRVRTGRCATEVGAAWPATHAFVPAATIGDLLPVLAPLLAPLARVVVEGALDTHEPTLVSRSAEPSRDAVCAELERIAAAAGFALTHVETGGGRLAAVLRRTASGDAFLRGSEQATSRSAPRPAGP